MSTAQSGTGTSTDSDTRPTIPLTTPTVFTQHILNGLTTIFTPHRDFWLAAVGPDYFRDAPYRISAEQFHGFWCIPPQYLTTLTTTPWYSQCYPEATQTSDGTFRPFWGPFSPALYCPSGWTTAMTIQPATASRGHVYMVNSRTLTPNNPDFFVYYPTTTLLPGETGAVCCPS